MATNNTNAATSEAVTITTSACSDKIEITFQTDGTGIASADYDEERFNHDVPSSLIHQAKQTDADGADARIQLETAFWEHINPTFDDPFITDGELEDADISFASGNLAEFEQLICDALSISDSAWKEGDESIRVSVDTSTESESAQLSEWCDETNRLPRRVQNLLTYIIDWAEPSGHRWDYNDGASYRQSGYSEYSDTITVEAPRPTASGRAEALERLIAFAEREQISGMLELIHNFEKANTNV